MTSGHVDAPRSGWGSDLDGVAVEIDTVVAEWVWSIPNPASGDRARNFGLSYYGFEDGRIIKVRQYFDTASFLSQFE
jgi:ketosteroid isomerase-like protein